MWISGVLLRWYKSFNTRYEGYSDHSSAKPLQRDKYDGGIFPYVHIPLDSRITTVVGANESGKSHLLSAISKVFTGHGNADDYEQTYAIQDICRYCAFEELEKNVWPNLGIEITFTTAKERDECLKAFGIQSSDSSQEESASPGRCTVIIDGSRPDDKHVSIYDESDTHLGDVAKDKWYAQSQLRLPAFHYIDARMELSNEVHVSQLLGMYENNNPGPAYDPLVLHEVAEAMSSLGLRTGQEVPPDSIVQYNAVLKKLKASVLGPKKAAMLETKLFKDVLDVPKEILQELASMSASDRGYVERRVAEINHRLNERLDITHFWQQDDAFRLNIVYKSGFFYFEITDRTEATYTFNERSSGLRFFLSYYIQAKAIEKANQKRGSLVVMDEPDGFLSVAGQRNLLRIFESLVNPKQSSGTCQVIYTTHSPFLINRNFPQRVRLVRKGDGGEGTQYVRGSATRRYEPIRSALSISCAETLFMGAVNVVVEGPSDQRVIVGGIQKFGDPSAVDEYLDLNKVSFVSAQGVGQVRPLIERSTAGDDQRPIVVVLLDGDGPGSNTYQELTEQDVLDRAFVATLDTVGLHTPWQSSPKILEDMIPHKMLAFAAQRYLTDRWKETTTIEEAEAGLCDVSHGDDIAKRLVAFTRLKMGAERSYLRDADVKGGVLDVLVECLFDDAEFNKLSEINDFKINIKAVCVRLQTMIDAAEGHARRETMQKCIRLIEERFRKAHAHGATKAEVDRFISRFEGECVGPSTEARLARENLVALRSLLEQEVEGASDAVAIAKWKQRFSDFKNRPWRQSDNGWK